MKIFLKNAFLRRCLAIGALFLTLSANESYALVRITDDPGGLIGRYIEYFAAIRQSKEQVIVDGNCLSACTLVLGLVPRNRICVTRRAMFGFHAAWMPTPESRTVADPMGTKVLWDIYPSSVRQWLLSKGGLRKKMVFLAGAELTAMFAPCPDRS
jgi:hypothetical protein